MNNKTKLIIAGVGLVSFASWIIYNSHIKRYPQLEGSTLAHVFEHNKVKPSKWLDSDTLYVVLTGQIKE